MRSDFTISFFIFRLMRTYEYQEAYKSCQHEYNQPETHIGIELLVFAKIFLCGGSFFHRHIFLGLKLILVLVIP